MSPIISGAELSSLLSNQNLILLDATNSKDAFDQFQNCHILGAQFIDTNTALASLTNDPAVGGRHPLPKPETFAATLSEFGIAPTSHVVIYDQFNGANAAARCWWMLKAIGHQQVQVLDGGLKAAKQVGIPTSNTAVSKKDKTNYPFSNWLLPIVDMQFVADHVQLDDFIVIDVREEKRYNGEIEPIDTVAGHIPGAINLPFQGNLDENGCLLSPTALKEKYIQILGDFPVEKQIVHCGSGVTACHTLLALHHAGFKIPSLYVGSWSEWSRNNLPLGKLVD